MQGAGGMITMPKGYLKGLRDLCTKYNVLFITDEVATDLGVQENVCVNMKM